MKIFISIIFLLISCFWTFESYAKIIKIYPGFKSIQNLINEAHNGDTLLVQPGNYKQHDIIIKNKIALIGIGLVIIDAENKFQVFTIYSDSVIIQGFVIQNIGKAGMSDMAGIKIINAKNVIIIHNKFFNNTFAVYLQNASYCFVLENFIHSDSKNELNGGNGIHAWKCDHLFIKGNTISGQRDGIYFEFVTDSRIVENKSSSNLRYGLHFMFSHNDIYLHNSFKDNGAGVAVMYSKGVIMDNNEFLHNWGDACYGLLLKEISESKIEHNRFSKNTIGIHMESTTKVDVMHNLFIDNGWALRVQASCTGSNVIENNFIGNSFDVATNGTLNLNYFNRNFWDKYDGYDLDRNNIGDVPYYPVSMYSVIAEQIPIAMILYHSLLTNILDQVEKVLPSMIPEKLKDDHPMMKQIKL